MSVGGQEEMKKNIVWTTLVIFVVLINPFAAYAQNDQTQVEIGAHYSAGGSKINWAFGGTSSMYGDPVSTIDWLDQNHRVGEVFANFLFPNRLYVKTLAGQGQIKDGEMIDRDFLEGQIKFSDMSSKEISGGTRFLRVDAGYAFLIRPNISIGLFGGYHYWQSDVTGVGLYDNIDEKNFKEHEDSEVMKYDSIWHVWRVGIDAQVNISSNWSLNLDWAFVPKAHASNADSHYLRTQPWQLGPTPNVFTRTDDGKGREVEAFVSYRLPKSMTLVGGFRYWNLSADDGIVELGPEFVNNSLRKFRMQQTGILVGIKKTF